MKKLFLGLLMLRNMDLEFGNGGGVAEFGGENYAAFGGEDYTGIDDDAVDFGSAGVSFINENATGRTYTFEVANTTATAVKVGMGASIAAVAGSTQLKEGLVVAGVTCTGITSNYDVAKKFFQLNPTRLNTLKITSSNEEQLSANLGVTHVDVYGNAGTRNTPISAYTREGNFNNKMVTLKDLNFQFDDQTDISINIPANTVTTFICFMGACSNSAKTLATKATRALRSA